MYNAAIGVSHIFSVIRRDLREGGMGPEDDDQVAELGGVLGDQPRRRLVGAHAEHACQVGVEQAAQELHFARRVRVARLGRHAPVVRQADVHCLADGHLAQVWAAQFADHVQTVPRYLHDVRLPALVRLAHARADVPRHGRRHHLRETLRYSRHHF